MNMTSISLELFRSDLLGALFILFLLYLIELLDFIRIFMLIALKNVRQMNIIYWLMNTIFPSLNGKRLFSYFLSSSSKNLCQVIRNDREIRSKIGLANEVSPDHLWKHCLLAFVHLLLITLLLCLIDVGFFQEKIRLLTNDPSAIKEPFDDEQLDDDVRRERLQLLSSSRHRDEHSLLLLDVLKRYAGQTRCAVNHLTLSIEQGHCFGLLGFNGAGE